MIPHAATLHTEGLVATDSGGNEIVLGTGGEWRFRHSTRRPILLLCNTDHQPVTFSILKAGAMATDPLQAVLRALDTELKRLGFTYFAFHFTPNEGPPDSYCFRVLLRVDGKELKQLVPGASDDFDHVEPDRDYGDRGGCSDGAAGGGQRFPGEPRRDLNARGGRGSGKAGEARGGKSGYSGGQ